MNQKAYQSALALLTSIAAEVADIRRAKEYGFWRQETAPRLNGELQELAPFSALRDVWILTGDGGGVAANPRFGEWAIDRLVEKLSPAAILERFIEEAATNVGRYNDVSPVLGVSIDERVELSSGVILEPPGEGIEGLSRQAFYALPILADGTSVLVQSYTVEPAYRLHDDDAHTNPIQSETRPTMADRIALRERVRLACLVAGSGPAELPLTALRPSREDLFVAGEGNRMERPIAAPMIFARPLAAAALKRACAALAEFPKAESLTRAIDRLGRSRIATSPTDRALDLGMAAEMVLMHEQSGANTEIAHKISARAAWLLGEDFAEREAIFADMKRLYGARSKAAHEGHLGAKATLDLDAADSLVARVISGVLDRGRFPDWTRLTLGGS